jgi:hypothetical protein
MPLTLGRVVLIVVVCSLLSAGLTLVSAHGSAPPPPVKVAAPAQATLTVPDVRGQAYVFAKGALESAGFAWRVAGRTQGYAAMVVATQSPAPGTVLRDSGDPLITLRLLKPKGYLPTGEPQNASPYAGVKPEAVAAAGTTAPAPQQGAALALGASPAKAAGPSVKRARPKRAATTAAATPSSRPPAFHIRGAKREPAGELPLPERARLLGRWLSDHPKPTAANQRHWLYQHAWIVEGARFGWWHGAQALRLLIRVDERVQKLWGIGAASERVARQALTFVEAHSR